MLLITLPAVACFQAPQQEIGMLEIKMSPALGKETNVLFTTRAHTRRSSTSHDREERLITSSRVARPRLLLNPQRIPIISTKPLEMSLYPRSNTKSRPQIYYLLAQLPIYPPMYNIRSPQDTMITMQFAQLPLY